MGSVQENNCTNTLPGCEFVICVERLGDVDIFESRKKYDARKKGEKNGGQTCNLYISRL